MLNVFIYWLHYRVFEMNEKQEHFLLECIAYALVGINPSKYDTIMNYVFGTYKKLGEDDD